MKEIDVLIQQLADVEQALDLREEVEPPIVMLRCQRPSFIVPAAQLRFIGANPNEQRAVLIIDESCSATIHGVEVGGSIHMRHLPTYGWQMNSAFLRRVSREQRFKELPPGVRRKLFSWAAEMATLHATPAILASANASRLAQQAQHCEQEARRLLGEAREKLTEARTCDRSRALLASVA